MSITKERLIDILNTYVRNDAEGVESDYLRDAILYVMDEEEAKMLGLSDLLGDVEREDQNGDEKKIEDINISEEELTDIIDSYIRNDAECAESDYLRDSIYNAMSDEEIKELGLEDLLEENDDGEEY